MARSKKRKPKMSQKRRNAVKKIEHPHSQKSSNNSSKPNTTLTRPTDYAANLIEIQNARALGLSVSSDTTDGQLQRQLAEFRLAQTYVCDVWTTITGQTPDQRAIDETHFNRFIANLLTDGRLAIKIANTQKKRAAKNTGIKKKPPFREVKNHLYAKFSDALPKQSLIARILG